ncbi:MAG TPA: class F sortase [Anaerolineales bacterium]|nr:class F sortase [Anaerolineales bacterium]
MRSLTPGVWRRLARLPLGRKMMMALGFSGLSIGAILIALGLSSAVKIESRSSPAVVDLGDEDAYLHLLNRRPSVAASLPPRPPLSDSGYRMVIGKIGVDAPVDVYGLDDKGVPEVPLGPDAAEVVAWYNFSARPGTGSNAVFAGHVTWNGKAVFYDLQTLEPGDVIELVGVEGTRLTYVVSANFAVDPNDPDSLQVMQPTDTDVITLITCGGTFFETDDPVAGGDYTLRVIVRAELGKIAASPGAGVDGS